MGKLGLLAIKRYARLLWLTLTALLEPGRRKRGALVLLLLWPLLIFVQIFNWLFWLIDELVFPGYRNVDVSRPLFVIGPPRTGTTFLHHVLAADPDFTTFRLWECLFGVSITGRRICLGLAAIDRAIGGPVARGIDWMSTRLLSGMDDVHPIRLDDPEEDFLVFLPFASCFLLLVPFPRAEWLWQIARLDSDLPPAERRLIARWYRKCIQKHLYVFGKEKCFLSKNASFAGSMETLLEEFPDSDILTTWREPLEAVPSQLSSLRPGLETFGFTGYAEDLRDRLVELMAYYYSRLDGVESRHPDRTARIRNTEMRENLESTVKLAFEKLGREPGDALLTELKSRSSASRSFKSGHEYSLEEFGLSDDLIRSRFRTPAA